MANTKKNAPKTWNGFAFKLELDSQLGLAILVAEYETGAYEPVAVASTINEAREIAASHDAARTKKGLPELTYKLWAQGVEGRYLTVPVAL
jgi:hypothetical protein